jgi:LPS-assembly protein
MKFFCKLLIAILLLSFITNFAYASGQRGANMKAKEVHYDANNNTITATGDVFIQMEEYMLHADVMHYDVDKDVVYAEGNVRIIDEKGRTIYGEKAVFKDKLKKGIIEEFMAKLDDNIVIVSRTAKRVKKNRVILEKSVFTPCEFNCSKTPIWQISSAKTDIDYDKQTITYRNLFFEVYGIPLIYLPYFSHPSPNAKAQSGILGPQIKQNNLLIPFYFRPKSNIDATISPRLSKDYTIFETEFRHKLKNGYYDILGSFGNPPLSKSEGKKGNKDSRPGRYHIFAKGNFVENRINFGFDIKRASDKAYLTNYHELFDSYLTSKIYTNTVDTRDYFSLEGYYFQDLRVNEKKTPTPFVFPSVRTKKVYSFNDDETILLNVKSDTIAYQEPENLGLARTSVDLELMNNVITNNGHMMTYSVANRGDLYWVESIDKNTLLEHQRGLYRNIPEFRTRWRYPLIKSFSESTLKLEPTAMLVLGRKFENRFNKVALVDSNRNELSENNIFLPNRFSGIDHHDYGTRLSYGINSSLISNHIYVDAFLGQLFHKNNVSESGNSDYVGNATIDLKDNFEIFYRFRRDKELKPIRNEIGIMASAEKFNATTTFTELHNISKYFAKDEFKPSQDKMSQLNFDVNYQLKKDLWVGTGARLDVSTNRTKILVRSIKVTYLFDCVSISGTVTDNFLQDSVRGVKKTRTQTFMIGLKAINM